MSKEKHHESRVSYQNQNYIFYQAVVQAQFRAAASEQHLLSVLSVLMLCTTTAIASQICFALVLLCVFIDMHQDRKILKRMRKTMEQDKEFKIICGSFCIPVAYVLFVLGLIARVI